MKVTHADIQVYFNEITKGTRFLARDLMFKCLYGRLPQFIMDDGRKLISMPTRVDISNLLDNVDWTPGTMLFRGERFWLPVPPGNQGDVLRFSSLSIAPVWGAPTSGFTPATCVVTRTTNQTAANSWPKFVPWQASTLLDYPGWLIGAPDQVVIPDGVARARLSCNIALTNDATARSFAVGFEKNLSGTNDPDAGGVTIRSGTAGFANNQWYYSSPWLNAAAGDVWRVRVNVSPTYSAGVLATSTFSVEVA